MKRHVATIVLLLALGLATAQAQSIKDAFRAMPDSVLPLLTRNDRLDFIDYMEGGAKAEVKNRFGAPATMTALTDDFLSVRTSEVSEVSFKMLPLKPRDNAVTPSLLYVICMVATCTVDSMGDSSLAFFSSSWEPVPNDKFLAWPQTSDFVAASFASGSTDLVLVRRAQRLSAEGERPIRGEPQRTVLHWDGERFQP